MADIKIRPAVPEDAPAIAALNTAAMGYNYPEDKTAAKLKALLADGRNGIFIAEVDGVTAGYIHLCDYDLLYADHMKNIMGIAVDEKYRRMGVGSALLKAGEEWALATGADGVRLTSGETRTGAHAFYRSQGYEGSKMQLNLKKTF